MAVITTQRIVFAMTCACAASGWMIARRRGNQMTAEAAPSTAAAAAADLVVVRRTTLQACFVRHDAPPSSRAYVPYGA